MSHVRRLGQRNREGTDVEEGADEAGITTIKRLCSSEAFIGEGAADPKPSSSSSGQPGDKKVSGQVYTSINSIAGR